MAPAATAGNQGLYDSQYEHDACGVGFVADLSGRRTHDTVAQALTVLRNLEHRGAMGSDPETGDGAGILTQIPDAFFRTTCDFTLPAPGFYAAGMTFLPTDEAGAAQAMATAEAIAAQEGLAVLGWREIPHNPSFCGQGALAVLPRLAQLFVASTAGGPGGGGAVGAGAAGSALGSGAFGAATAPLVLPVMRAMTWPTVTVSPALASTSASVTVVP